MQCINVKLKFRDRIASGYLRGTTYLRTPLFGMILVVTLFVVCAGAVVVMLCSWDGNHGRQAVMTAGLSRVQVCRMI